MAAWSTALTELGAPTTEHDMHVWIGRTDRNIAEHYAPTIGLDVEEVLGWANREFDSLLERNGLTPFADALSLLSEAETRGLAIGCATNSARRRLEWILRASALDDRFVVTVAADEVDAPKPSPHVYLAAIGQLGVEPGRTLVVEDSPVGIAAGRQAGCRVVAVDRGVFGRQDLAAAHRVVTSLV